MPLDNFDNDTFLAFTDISGFKKMMSREQGVPAIRALDNFFREGYQALSSQRKTGPRVDGLFISDCGILFVRNPQERPALRLNALLRVVRDLNQRLLPHHLMLTTSIAYGQFRFENRIEFQGIEKNNVFGNAYVNAYLDQVGGFHKLQPGKCRVLLKNLPEQILNEAANANNDCHQITKKDKHYLHYYWMCNSADQIEGFENRYEDAPYEGILRALQPNHNN
jgi:hypothetical protein